MDPVVCKLCVHTDFCLLTTASMCRVLPAWQNCGVWTSRTFSGSVQAYTATSGASLLFEASNYLRGFSATRRLGTRPVRSAPTSPGYGCSRSLISASTLAWKTANWRFSDAYLDYSRWICLQRRWTLWQPGRLVHSVIWPHSRCRTALGYLMLPSLRLGPNAGVLCKPVISFSKSNEISPWILWSSEESYDDENQ